MALHSAAKGKLISVIGDEVSVWIDPKLRNMALMRDFPRFARVQDTCVGFLLGGVGEINKNRHPNFMVVDKSE